jgi:hypothetical protein
LNFGGLLVLIEFWCDFLVLKGCLCLFRGFRVLLMCFWGKILGLRENLGWFKILKKLFGNFEIFEFCKNLILDTQFDRRIYTQTRALDL